jgi:hypothetical protein
MEGTRQTLQENSVGFSLWENTEIPWDVLVLFFSTPPLINNNIFLPILFREKLCFTVCFMVNEALVAPKSAEILHPFDLDIDRVRDCKL